LARRRSKTRFSPGSSGGGGGGRGGLGRILGIAVLLVIVGGGVALAVIDFRPPTQTVEKIISNDKFKQ
jgi:hypothetical protein